MEDNTNNTKTENPPQCENADPASEEQPKVAGGRNGINNIGNTCYMSTGLQCLSHIPDLTKLFLSKEYYSMLNRDNCMGSGGLVAESYAALLQKLWEEEKQTVNPKFFKKAFQGYDSQFSGVDQHDSQEFVAKLVDVLHEDLNLIKKKPYIETPVYTSYDKSQGDEMWNLFLQRNTSSIVDTLYGMTCTQIECSECHEKRIRYEPNNVLMLPMPQEKFQVVINTLVEKDFETEYDEAKEDARRHDDSKRTDATKSRKTPFRAFRLKYVYTEYNFYGMCSELYEAAAESLQVDVKEIDLFVQYKGDVVSAVLIRPEDPQSSLSQHIEAGAQLICQIKPRVDMKPILLRQSYLLYYKDVESLFVVTGDYASLITYYDPNDTVGAFLQSLRHWFFPKFRRNEEHFQERVSTVLSAVVSRIIHDEKGGEAVSVKRETESAGHSANDSLEETKMGDLSSEGDELEAKTADLLKANLSSEEEDEDFEDEDGLDEDGLDEDGLEEDGLEEDDAEELEHPDPLVEECSSCENTCLKREGCVCDYFSKRRHTHLYYDSKEYATWKTFGCHFPVIMYPYSEYGVDSPLSEYFINSIILEKHADRLCRDFFVDDKTIPTIALVVDAEFTTYHNKITDLFQAKTKTPSQEPAAPTHEEGDPADEAFDELSEVYTVKAHSLQYCKSSKWKKEHNLSTDVSLEKCMEMFVKKGDNDPNTLWFCPKCQKDVIASSVSSIWKAPRYLLIQLSRFEYVTNNQLGGTFSFDDRKRKVETKVEFPLTDFDLTEYIHKDAIQQTGSCKYDLIAVCNHFGNSDCGHYIAYCRDENDETPRWFEYDDDLVTPLKEKEVCTADAYMLVYKRQDVDCSTKDVLKIVEEKMKK